MLMRQSWFRRKSLAKNSFGFGEIGETRLILQHNHLIINQNRLVNFWQASNFKSKVSNFINMIAYFMVKKM
jgi:hypothetical protein